MLLSTGLHVRPPLFQDSTVTAALNLDKNSFTFPIGNIESRYVFY